jgi:hypothetical protein
MPGPAPKDKKLLQRRNKKSTAMTFKDVKSVNDIPELPVRRRKWRPETLAWWKSVQESPMAREGKFIEVDLHRLYMVADLVDEYWRLSSKDLGRKASLANEIRLQGQCFGMTPIDRSRLDWQFEKAGDAKNRSQKRQNERYKLDKHRVDPRTVIEAKN